MWISWLKYLSFIYWGWNLLLKIEFQDQVMTPSSCPNLPLGSQCTVAQVRLNLQYIFLTPATPPPKTIQTCVGLLSDAHPPWTYPTVGALPGERGRTGHSRGMCARRDACLAQSSHVLCPQEEDSVWEIGQCRLGNTTNNCTIGYGIVSISR